MCVQARGSHTTHALLTLSLFSRRDVWPLTARATLLFCFLLYSAAVQVWEQYAMRRAIIASENDGDPGERLITCSHFLSSAPPQHTLSSLKIFQKNFN